MTMSDDPRLNAVEAFLARQRETALIAEAEDLTHGARHLTIVTGQLETAEDVDRVEQLTATAWRGRPGAQMRRSLGGSDYVTFVIEGEQAERFVDELATLAATLNPGYWRIARTLNPF